MNMKGIVLAGGYGTRLDPLTRQINKHLLPVWSKPMIYYPIQTLLEAGVRDIMIVTGGQQGDFLRQLGSGRDFDPALNLHYTYQEGAGGIPDAMRCARNFVGDDPACVILGDNIFAPGSGKDFTEGFEKGGRILLRKVDDPNRFGVAVIRDDRITHIQEKPEEFISPYAITGLYCFDNRVWDVIDTLKASDRGELEVTDIHRYYLKLGELDHRFCGQWWTDAGTFESLYMAGVLARESDAH